MSIYMSNETEGAFKSWLDQAAHMDIYRDTKAEIVQYYQDNFPERGKGSWKRHIIHDIAQVTGKKEKNMERRFDPSRLHNPEKRNAEDYKKLGKLLPPIRVPRPIRRGAKIGVQAVLYFSGKGYNKNFTIHLDREETERLIESQEIDTIIEAYGINPEDVEEIFLESFSISID